MNNDAEIATNLLNKCGAAELSTEELCKKNSCLTSVIDRKVNFQPMLTAAAHLVAWFLYQLIHLFSPAAADAALPPLVVAAAGLLAWGGTALGSVVHTRRGAGIRKQVPKN